MRFRLLVKCTVWLVLFFSASIVYSQQLSSVTTDFTAACASSSFNSFSITFKWAPPMPNAGNQYIIELSDASGSFDNPTTLKTITGQNASIEITTTVQLPTTVHGEGYKIRVSSTNPSTSVVSDAFPAYYLNVTTPMVLNGGVSALSLCPGFSQTISVDKQSEVAYKWYRDGTLIPGETGYSLEVSQAGVYYAVVDYGTFCTTSSNSRSNNVTVSVLSSVGLSISGTPADGYICLGDAYTMNANVSNASYTYTWYKNGTQVASGTGLNSYTTSNDSSAAGSYYLEVSSGGTCSERSNTIDVNFQDSFTASISSSDGSTVVIPGKTKTLNVTTTAQSASYQWYFNGGAISGATSSSYNASNAGDYYVRVTQSGTCSALVDTGVFTLVNPSNFNVSIGTKTSYQNCLYDRITLEVKNITAINGPEAIELDESDYGLFTYTWYNGATVSALSNSNEIELTSASENGTYTVQLATTGYSSIPRSNAVTIQLLDANYVLLNGGASTLEFCTASSTLEASVQDASATYTWYKDDVQVSQGVGEYTYEVSESGRYYVAVTTSGACDATSNYIETTKQQVTAGWVVPVSATGKYVYLNYRTYTLNLTHSMTNPTIVWYRNGTVIPGETGTSLTLTSAGAYYAELTDQGGCGITISTRTKRYIAPNAFITTIGYKENQSTCDGTQAVMEIQKLEAVLSDGSGDVIEIPSSEYGNYTYQWMVNGTEVSGATSQEITVPNSGNNTSNSYSLVVGYTTIFSTSNELEVTFVSIPDITIASSDSNVLCNGNTLELSSSLTSASYDYQWYRNATAITDGTGTGTTLSVSQVGEYYVVASYGGCSKQSERFNVINFDGSLVSVDVDTTQTITITGLNGVTVTASGADSYLWTAPDGSVVSSNATAVLTTSGVYVLTATIGNCRTTISIPAKAILITEIPNVVTPNGDGYNDTWAIPNIYSYRNNVKVIIYSADGKEEVSTFNYQNDWPRNYTKTLGNRALIYLYTIEVDGEVKEQGTISLFK